MTYTTIQVWDLCHRLAVWLGRCHNSAGPARLQLRHSIRRVPAASGWPATCDGDGKMLACWPANHCALVFSSDVVGVMIMMMVS